MLRKALVVTLLLVSLAALAGYAAPNIYPDPGFEKSGQTGAAHSGDKAAYLKVGAENHWDAFGGPLAVEPFARYRVTEWVKGTVSPGSYFVAPYVYEWDNYEWAFSTGRAMQTSNEWAHVSLAFVSPHPQIQFHPLAYIGAHNSEVWADDVVIEKIAEPDQVMAEIEAKTDRSQDEVKLLARWYVKQGKIGAIEPLLQAATDRLLRADLSCLLGQNTKDAAARRPFVLANLLAGGPSYNDGVKRFNEITAGLSDDEKLGICAEALKSRPEADVAQAYRRVFDADLAALSGPMPVSEMGAKVAALRQALQGAVAAIPATSPAAKELQVAMKSLDDTQKAYEERKASLGTCKIVLGGQTITPATHAIVIPDRATLQEKHAAQDLAYHLELITGQTIKVVPEAEAGNLTPLLVGKCRATRRLARDVDFKGLGIEGIHAKTVGPALILAGNRRGVLYATYTFLEDYLGCRWFTPECRTWPRVGTITVASVDKRYIPPLEYRGTDYPVSLPADYSVRNRYNGGNHQPDEARGGHVGVHSLAHTFNYLVPPDQYFAKHPEYFSEVGGKRLGPADTQLCLTNPDVVKIATESIRRWIKQNPDKTIFSVSQNDYANFCTCPKCKAIADEEGAQSGLTVRFINQIADAIKDESPNVAIETLAYQYTRKPPKFAQPRPNVIICLCSIECCFIHPLGTDPFNKTFVDDIKGWHKICNRLYIWDYVINYAHSVCPFPNLRVLKPNTQFFIDNGVKGIYEESCYWTKGSEAQELRAYIMAKTLWDPKYDTEKAIDEFCAAFYGPAGKIVREYINLIHDDTQKSPKLHVAIYTHPKSFVTPSMIAKSNAIFDRAEAAVKDDPLLLHRVQVARLPIMYAEITLAKGGAFSEHGDNLVQDGGTDVSAIAEKFGKIAREEGLASLNEGGASVDSWLQRLPKKAHEVKIEKLANPRLEVSILPEIGGRIWRLKSLPAGTDLIKMIGKPGQWEPADGGYEEYSEGTWRSAGCGEPYAVKERTERAVTMEADLVNGLRITRRIELDATKPTLTITSTVTNMTNGAKSACLRGHPEFAVQTTQKATVRILKADGTWRTENLADPNDPTAEKNVWLQGADIPNGAWAFSDDAAGWSLTCRVPRAQIGQCLLNWSGSQNRVNLEVYSPEAKLDAGGSLTLEQRWEVGK